MLADKIGIQTVDEMKAYYVSLTEVGNCTGRHIMV